MAKIAAQVMRMIKHTNGNISLAECARTLHYHPTYIWKVLKRQEGVSFRALVNAEKLKTAKHMLLTTDASVAQIAEKLKYYNVQNFIRFFKSNTQTTPAVYKQEHAKEVEIPGGFYERGSTMKLHLLENRTKEGCTTFGAVWHKGEVTGKRDYVVKNTDGTCLPLQTRTTAYYPDGSVKWTAHTVNASGLTPEIELVDADAAGGLTLAPPVIEIREEAGEYLLSAKGMSLRIPKGGKDLFRDFMYNSRYSVLRGFALLKIERRTTEGNAGVIRVFDFAGITERVTLEERGPYRMTVKYEGIHVNPDTGERLMPFVIRMQLGAEDPKLKFTHTLLFDGVEERDYLKGYGIRFQVPVTGAMYNRHVKISGDYGSFHESCALLSSWQPKLPVEIYEAQIAGRKLVPEFFDRVNGADAATAEKVETILKDMPFWDTYRLIQEFYGHFSVRKKMAGEGVCLIDCLEGSNAKGVLAVGGENGAVSIAIRDFSKKTPAELAVSGLSGEMALLTGWFYSPAAEAYDFRHYATRGYHKVCYEGYDYFGASAYGIAVTSELAVSIGAGVIPDDKELECFYREVNSPPVYVGEPEFYHERRAFGFWSLEGRETELEQWLEGQLCQAFEFYKNEISQRRFYGLFNYGDFMHSYDSVRHMWKYDMGGYAWDNTELVPTLWLWLYFMRTGREDVFTLAEKLSRHTSEVDVYHFGEYQGMGSRHNVRHWGCPCKEARIAMAGHHRYCYYLTGDFRFGDIFEEIKDNEETFLRRDPLGDFYDKEEMVYPTHARSGPDWSSLCSNWMTRWERFHDLEYRDKIRVGIEDIKQAPLRLSSGPAYEFDPASRHLRYIGEVKDGSSHLQVCMGAPSVWMELGELLDDDEWREMIADSGRFYYLPKEEKQRIAGGILHQRTFAFPYFASAMAAYGAWYFKDRDLAETTWSILLGALISETQTDGFQVQTVEHKGNQKELREIPWIGTNFTAQWCLNVIMVLDFIRADLPETMEAARELIKSAPKEFLRRA